LVADFRDDVVHLQAGGRGRAARRHRGDLRAPVLAGVLARQAQGRDRGAARLVAAAAAPGLALAAAFLLALPGHRGQAVVVRAAAPPAAGAGVDALDVAVLRLDVDGVRVGRIDRGLEAVAAADGAPVVQGDPVGAVGGR